MQIAYGSGVVQGMLQSQDALQKDAMVLYQECSTLSEENALLRMMAGQPPKCCPGSDDIPASAAQCPAGAQTQPPSEPSVQPTPSPLCCIEV